MSVPYLDYGGTQMLRPPYVAENVGFYGFLVQADLDALKRLIDERLNEPSGGTAHFEPAGPFVLFVFVTLEKMYSQNPPDRDKGWFSEQEFAVWVRVVDRVRNRGFWFHPYMFVDNSYALVLGREVYGFPKAWGWMNIETDPAKATSFSMETLLLPKFSPQTQGTRQKLVSATRVSGGNDVPKMIEDGVEFVAEVMNLLVKSGSFADLLEELEHAFQDLWHRSEPFAFLKQFPTPDVPGTACYQAIVESENDGTAVHGACLMTGDWQIDITPADSHPIALDLGLKSNTVQSAISFYVNFDMIVGFGTNIYTAPASGTAPKKIAILGGGVGAMATALELTAAKDWQSRYDITIYQMGWRLGGKGASGRGDDGRILEHGLHIWLGFYENAFRVMRAVYEENKANRPVGAPLREWSEAFHKHSFITLMDRTAKGSKQEWGVWPVDFPEADGVPGDGKPITLWDTFVQLIRWIETLFHKSDFHRNGERKVNDDGFQGTLERLFASVGSVFEIAGELLLSTQITAIRAAAEALHSDPRMHSKEHHESLGNLLAKFRGSLRTHLDQDLATNVELRRLYELLDLATTIAKGLLMGGYLSDHRMLDHVEEELEAWLLKEGADPVHCSTDTSAVLRGLYDLVFAYRNGYESQPSFEGGVALRSILLIVGAYKGSIFWKMQAGMGDTVFGPMYQVLKQRGVKFEFFHRVEELVVSSAGTQVDAIRMSVQATLKDPRAGYSPLKDFVNLPCWPQHPLYDQLVEGKELEASNVDLESFWTTWKNPAEKTLQAGKDFDQVVLAISLAGLPFLFSEGANVPPAMRTMMQNVETVRTQAMQLWVNLPLEKLGWTYPSVVLDAYTEFINTWAVMDQLLVREEWPADTVKGIHYFCGQMAGGIPPRSDAGAPQEAYNQVVALCKDFIEKHLPVLWPAIQGNPNFKIVSDYYRANINPTERYVMSVAGSTKYRLRANESGLGNVILAGDWTKNGFNAGCVEAAVMSGMQAANAIAGRPLDEGITGPLASQLDDQAVAAAV